MTTQAVILAAGQSKRMKSKTSKVFHSLCGRRIIDYVLDLVESLNIQEKVIVINPEMKHEPWPKDVELTLQDPPLGTGDAVKRALPALGYADSVLVLFGDTPLITKETIKKMFEVQSQDVVITLLGMRPPDPTGYGRLILSEDGDLVDIVEHRDLQKDQCSIEYCNSGVMLVKKDVLARLIEEIRPHNIQQEYYLTDLVRLAAQNGLRCRAVEGPYEEFMGINTRKDLAIISQLLQDRLRTQFMLDGVTLMDPDTVYFSHDTQIASDVTIHPHVTFGPGVKIREGAEVLPFCHLTHCQIGQHCVVGPFAHLRGHAVMDEKSEVGNFVELKKTHMHKGSKAKHLSYLGDAQIGKDANIGAGTITCNYDGFNKFETHVGEAAFVGTNCSLVAPLSIGARAILGAGSVITEDVDDNTLAIARPEQKNLSDGAIVFREKRLKSKKIGH